MTLAQHLRNFKDISLIVSASDDWFRLWEWLGYHIALGQGHAVVCGSRVSPDMLKLLEELADIGLISWHSCEIAKSVKSHRSTLKELSALAVPMRRYVMFCSINDFLQHGPCDLPLEEIITPVDGKRFFFLRSVNFKDHVVADQKSDLCSAAFVVRETIEAAAKMASRRRPVYLYEDVWGKPLVKLNDLEDGSESPSLENLQIDFMALRFLTYPPTRDLSDFNGDLSFFGDAPDENVLRRMVWHQGRAGTVYDFSLVKRKSEIIWGMKSVDMMVNGRFRKKFSPRPLEVQDPINRIAWFLRGSGSVEDWDR